MRLFAGTEFDIPPRCDRCERLEEECQCEPEKPGDASIPPQKQKPRVRVEKRKRGKMVTVVDGLPASGNDLPALLTKLKNVCGAGGTIKNDCIEIQGTHVERVSQTLKQIGYQVKA